MPYSTKYQSYTWPIAGGSYSDKSKPLSQQRTLNMYPEQTQNGRTDVVLKSWPGLKPWVDGVGGADRGVYKRTFLSKVWQVAGTSLYSIDSSGTRTTVGTVAGSDQVTFADDGSQMMIIANNTAYLTDGPTVTTISYGFTPVSVDYLNNQFIIQATDGNVYISTPGTAVIATGNNFPFSSSSDSLVRSYVFDQFLMGFGESTIEPWENTGGGLIPPFERMSGVIAEQTGLAGIQAISNTNKALYFLGADNEAYQMVNFQANKIGTPATSSEFRSYGDNSSCRLRYVSFDNQDFILFIFPNQFKVWAFSEQTGLWFELDHDSNKLYLGNSFTWAFNKNLVADRSTGAIYELDHDTYQNNGVKMIRERVMRPLSGELFQNPRQKYQLRTIRYSLETGVGNTNEVNPKVMTEISTDGVSFANMIQHEIGREGERQQDIRHDSNKYFTDLVSRITFEDNARFTLYTAGVLFREAGR